MSERTDRVAEQLREHLGMLMEKDISDPRLELVTITAATVTPDLRHARIYYSVMGGAKKKAASAAGFESAKGHLRSALAHNMAMKFTPELHFVFDEAVETGEKIDRLINRYKSEET